MADGVAAKRWAPVSPVTGRLDAFVWQRPAERLGADLDALEWTKHWSLPTQPVAPPDEKPIVEVDAIAAPAPENPAQETGVAAPSAKVEADTELPQPAFRSMPEETSAPTNKASPHTQASSSEHLWASRAQKVVFPMAGPPDDPGPDAPSAPVVHRGSFF